MKNMKHSLGWHTVKQLSKKNNIKTAIIIALLILWILSALFGLTGGK